MNELQDAAVTDEAIAALNGNANGNGNGKHPFLVQLGERVRALRSRRGMTRKELAAAAEVSERHLGNLEFHPVGAPAVRIRFEREGAKVMALTVLDPDVVVRARKVT